MPTNIPLYVVKVRRTIRSRKATWLAYRKGDRFLVDDLQKAEVWHNPDDADRAAFLWTERTGHYTYVEPAEASEAALAA